MTLRFTGTARRPAYTRTAVDGAAYVCVELEQPGAGNPPLFASHRLGEGSAAQMVAHTAARCMPAGTIVTVVARRIAFRARPEAHFDLLEVQHLEYPTPRPRHEPQREAQEAL